MSVLLWELFLPASGTVATAWASASRTTALADLSDDFGQSNSLAFSGADVYVVGCVLLELRTAEEHSGALGALWRVASDDVVACRVADIERVLGCERTAIVNYCVLCGSIG